MKMLRAKCWTMSTNIVFFSSNFLNIFVSNLIPKFKILQLKFEWKLTILAATTYWKSQVYHLGYKHAKYQVSYDHYSWWWLNQKLKISSLSATFAIFSYAKCNQNKNTVLHVVGHKFKTSWIEWQVIPFWRLEE